LLVARHRFAGPPVGVVSLQRQEQIEAAEQAVHEVQEVERDDNWLAQAASRTPARIFVDRSGPAYRTTTQLELRRDHAFARDAVNDEVELARDFLGDFVASRQLFCVQSQARNKREFLLRPGLGRRLSDAAREELTRRCPHNPGVQIVLGDGLSAAAVVRQAPQLLPLLEEELNRRSWQRGQTFLVRHCRVGIINDIGDLLAPETIVLLIGERPGLATAESLSAYLAYRPRSGHTDANRNLISNIHSRGVACTTAAVRIANIIGQMCEHQTSGTAIKEQLSSLKSLETSSPDGRRISGSLNG
jgi:ethanolamine ammonia-lyase small subunit